MGFSYHACQLDYLNRNPTRDEDDEDDDDDAGWDIAKVLFGTKYSLNWEIHLRVSGVPVAQRMTAVIIPSMSRGERADGRYAFLIGKIETTSVARDVI